MIDRQGRAKHGVMRPWPRVRGGKGGNPFCYFFFLNDSK